MPDREWSDLLGVAALALGICVVIVLMYHVLGRSKRKLHREWSRLAHDLGMVFRPTKYRSTQAPLVGDLPVIDGTYGKRSASISLEWSRNVSGGRGRSAPQLLRALYAEEQFICTRVSVKHSARANGWAILAGKEVFDRALERLHKLDGQPWQSGDAGFDESFRARASAAEVAERLCGSLDKSDRVQALLSPELEGRLILDADCLSWESPRNECDPELLAGALELLSEAAAQL